MKTDMDRDRKFNHLKGRDHGKSVLTPLIVQRELIVERFLHQDNLIVQNQ